MRTISHAQHLHLCTAVWLRSPVAGAHERRRHPRFHSSACWHRIPLLYHAERRADGVAGAWPTSNTSQAEDAWYRWSMAVGVVEEVDSGLAAPLPPVERCVLMVLRPAVQFGNYISTVLVTGQQLIDALENGVSLVETVQGRFPQVCDW
jgi:hypothetical protein